MTKGLRALTAASLLLLVGAGTAAAGPYYDAVIQDAPIGYWRLGEAAGAVTAQDSSPFGRDLNYNNMLPAAFGQAGAVAGDPDTAVKFTPGSPNPTLTSPNTADFGFAAGQSFTVEYWIKALPGNASADAAGLATKGYDSAQVIPWYLSRYMANGRVDWFLRDSASVSRSVTSTTAVNDGLWHHVVGVYDAAAASIRLYVNGRLEGTATGVPADAYGTNTRPFTIANHSNRNLDASLDEVAVYNSALGDLRILDHYATGAGVPTLNVDFGNSVGSGGGPGGRQTGFHEFEAAEGSGNPPVVRSLDLLGTDGQAKVKMSGYTHFRDYAAITGTFALQSALLSDMVLRNEPGTMKLTLDDLPPGTWQITTYHHAQSSGGGGVLDIRLTDAAGYNQVVADGVQASSGTNPSSITTQTFQFTVRGSSVMIDFLGGSGTQHSPLNGFELTMVKPSNPVLKHDVLAIDFNARTATGPGNTQAGFQEFVLPGTAGGTRSFGAIDVTITPTGTSVLDDRRRTDPTNSGAFTQQELLRDFVFATGSAAGNGLDVLIRGLLPLREYEVTLWSFDDLSGGATSADRRLSDWSVNGLLAVNDYVFNGASVPPAPASDDVCSFSFLATANASGELLLSGRTTGGTAADHVFLNALMLTRVEVIPEPSTWVLASLGLVGLALAGRRRRRAVSGERRVVV